MSAGEKKSWLVCYDIRDKSRLSRVHKRLRSEGASLQYSAFTVHANDHQIRALLEALRLEIDEREDDVRAYHLPERCTVWMLGRQCLPDGITVDSETASRHLMAAAAEDVGGFTVV